MSYWLMRCHVLWMLVLTVDRPFIFGWVYEQVASGLGVGSLVLPIGWKEAVGAEEGEDGCLCLEQILREVQRGVG